MASGSIVVVIPRGGTSTESVKEAVAVTGEGVVLSVTCTVNRYVPCSLGMPEMAPLEERERPGGNDPALRVHA